MSDTYHHAEIVAPPPPLFDKAQLAVAGFLARYRGNTRAGYRTDLRCWFIWCAQHDLAVFDARRAHLELWARTMEEQQHLMPATVSRRLSTVAGFYRFAVIDGHLQHSPAEHVRRPKLDYESTTLGLDRMKLGAFLAQLRHPARSTTRWAVCSVFWACASRRPATLMSSIWGWSGGIARSR
jgi:integrase/recombinase XerD